MWSQGTLSLGACRLPGGAMLARMEGHRRRHPPPPDDHEWQPLSELNPAPKSAPPTAVRFPDNSTAATTAWNAMLVETVRWLMGSKHLSTTHCPVQLPGSKRYVVADRPIHPEDKKFFASAQVGSLYVEKNLIYPS